MLYILTYKLFKVIDYSSVLYCTSLHITSYSDQSSAVKFCGKKTLKSAKRVVMGQNYPNELRTILQNSVPVGTVARKVV